MIYLIELTRNRQRAANLITTVIESNWPHMHTNNTLYQSGNSIALCSSAEDLKGLKKLGKVIKYLRSKVTE